MMRAKQNKWKRHTRYPICQDFVQESEGMGGGGVGLQKIHFSSMSFFTYENFSWKPILQEL